MNQNLDQESLKQPIEQLKPFSELILQTSDNNPLPILSDNKVKSSGNISPKFKYGVSQPSQLLFKNMNVLSPYHDTENSTEKDGTKIICKETIIEIDEASPNFVSELVQDFKMQNVGQRSPQQIQQPNHKQDGQENRERVPRDAEELKNQIKKKKKVAKDDTMQDTNRWKSLKSSFEGPRNNYFEQTNEQTTYPTRQNIFMIERGQNDGQNPQMRTKRKMSATKYVNFKSQNQNPDLAEESEAEFDLTQSLLTLQLKNPDRPLYNKQQSQIFNQWDKSKKVENNLRGGTKDIPKETLLRRNSNYFGNASNLENDEDSNESQVKDQKSNADNQDSDLESVSLEDPELENIGKIKMVLNRNSSGKTINLNLQQAIEQAEIIEEANSIQSNHPETIVEEEAQQEEYESLVWGQSIWSTDVPKDSKKQFIQKLQHNAISQELDQDQEANDVDDFEDIHKNIQEQTIQEEISFEKPKTRQPMHVLEPIYEFNTYGEQPPYKISQGQYPSGQQEYYLQHHQNFAVQPPEAQNNEIQYAAYDQQSPIYNCGNSVHSGGLLNFPGHYQIGEYNATPNYNADAASSNFTQHPYSQYNQQPTQSFENQVNPNMLGNNHNQQNGNNAGQGYNTHNRDHIFINRQINKYMMNPIYKSKQTVTSLQMHRYTGVPWRGGTIPNNPNNMNTHYQMPVHQNTPQENAPKIESPPENFQNVQQSTEIIDQRYTLENLMENSTKEEQIQYQYIDQIASKVEETLDAQPFYPQNYGEQQRKKQQTINDSANILAAGKSARQKATPTIHVPIPIPIMRNKKLNQESFKNFNLKNQESSIFMNNFYRDDIILKKNELDKRMQETTQNLESKLIKAVQINDEEDNDDEEEEDLTFEVLSQHEPSESGVSLEREQSVLNKSINIKELKHHLGGTQQINFRNLIKVKRRNSDKLINEVQEQELKENKIKEYEEKIKRKTDRAAIFKKLQSQLSEFKTEMFTEPKKEKPIDIQLGNVASSVSPKRTSISRDLLVGSKLTPFKPDAKQYMDKVLNLMNIINEVDDLTNVAELKNRLEKQKLQLMKARAERDEVVNQLQYLQQTHRATEYQFREKETTYKQQQNEKLSIIQTLQQTMIQDREQNVQQIFSLTQQLDKILQESQSLMVQNSQMSENQNIQDQTIFNLHNNIGQLNNQIEQNNHNNYQLTSTLNQLQSENQKLQLDQENMEKEWVRKTDIVNRHNNGQFESDYSNANGEEDEDDVPLHEQLENANQQVKDLQEYIKKRGFEDLKNNQLRQDVISKNELAHQDKYLNLKKLKDQMEREKDKVIQRMKDFIINHNEPMLIGSCGSSMLSQFEEKKEDQLRIHDQSTIEAPSMDSFDNKDHDDYIRLIMNDYTCEKCEEKDRIILNNEQRITDYIAYIKKQSIQKSLSFREAQKSHVITQTDIDPKDLSLNTSNSSQDKSLGNLRSCHKILLSNYIRQFRVYLDNLDEEESEKTSKMQHKLSMMAQKQKITLFHEEEDPDTSLVTKSLIQEIVSMSLDMITDLLLFSNDDSSAIPVFKTVEFGLNIEQLKEMQNVARTERKSCHQIIVEIEKLMYDMNNLMGNIPDKDAVQIFGQILDTYLQLPHRLKPIFDHCKKIETIVLKALKSQDSIVKSSDSNTNK